MEKYSYIRLSNVVDFSAELVKMQKSLLEELDSLYRRIMLAYTESGHQYVFLELKKFEKQLNRFRLLIYKEHMKQYRRLQRLRDLNIRIENEAGLC